MKLFKRGGASRQQGITESGIDHLTGIATPKHTHAMANNNRTETTLKNDTTSGSLTTTSNIFDDPRVKKEYQLMTAAAKKASFGQCYFARHRHTGDIVMIMAIQNEFLNKFKADFSDANKLKSLMASVDPSLNGLREMIDLKRSTALVLDVDMNPTTKQDYDTVEETENSIRSSSTTVVAKEEPFDNFGSWLQYWVCGAVDMNGCAAPSGLNASTKVITCAPAACAGDENADSSNMNSPRTSCQALSLSESSGQCKVASDARSIGVLSRVIDVDDATTVAASKRISQHGKIRARKNNSKTYRAIASGLAMSASGDGSKTLPSLFSMDSHSIPPEEDWFSMLDELLTPDLR